MCVPGQLPAPPATAAQAAAMARAGLGWLAQADATTLTTAESGECLRDLEQVQSMHTAARSTVLAAFSASGGHEADGQPTARSWLRSQTRLTKGAANTAIAWVRRLAAHPHVAQALASGTLSESWAQAICGWTDRLPEDVRQDADQILLGAAAAGVELGDLAELAEELRKNTAVPDRDDDGGFGDRSLRLGTTFGGAGKLDGDLTAPAAAAVRAVLDALGGKAGPEDYRTQRQRDHDALEEAMRRLIASGCLPQRAGQPTQIQLNMTLDELRGLPGAAGAEAAWAAGPAAPPGADCDAQIVPIVTGHIDPDVVDRLAALLLRGTPADPATPTRTAAGGQAIPAAYTRQPTNGTNGTTGTTRTQAAADAASLITGLRPADTQWLTTPGWLAEAAARVTAATPPSRQPRPGDSHDDTRRRLAANAVRQIIIRAAADALSGPGGLAGWLRTRLTTGLTASVSLPLDAGATVDTVPASLRRLVIKRDRHCRFPGCDQPAMVCHPHHVVPRSEGGPTCLTNLALFCPFHHLIAIHRWGWGIVLLPDGTITATSPDGTQVLRSHGPPSQAA